MADLEYSQDRWIKRKDELCKSMDFEFHMVRDKEEKLRKRELELKKKEKSVRTSLCNRKDMGKE